MKYFWLQIKKLIRILPFSLIIASLLLVMALTVFSQFSSFVKSENESRFKIAVVGQTNSRFFNIGMSALKTLDTSRLSIDIELTDEQTAKEHLLTGQISAYVVIPKGFIKAAQYGKIIPISYYTTASTVDISAIMRDEITDVVSVLLKESQKGVFGEELLLSENGYKEIAVKEINELNIEYIDFIVNRTKMYKTDITGVSYGLDLIKHLFIGYTVIFLCVSVIPVICLTVRRDNSILKMLCAKGNGVVFSALLEFAAVLLVFLSTLLLLILGLFSAKHFLNLSADLYLGIDPGRIIIFALPVAVMVCAFAFLIFESAGNIISAVTGYFFSSIAFCYISGCMYPLYSLPAVLQKISAFTPTGAARAYISLSVTGNNSVAALITVFAYIFLFLSTAVLIRKHKLTGGEG